MSKPFLTPCYGRMLVLLYGLSGAVALCYEVLWSKMLNLAFGVSIFGVTVTVAAFMLGLGIGSLFGLRWIRNIRHPLRLFALLEGGVAMFALSFSAILRTGTAFTEQWTLGLPVESWFAMQGVFLVLVLLLPTVAMGMGFPVVLRVMQEQVGSVGRLYGVNTLGGALGALLPLLLLPWLGTHAGLTVTAVLGLTVAVLALGLSTRIPGQRMCASSDEAPPCLSGAVAPWLCYACMGAAALMLEIGWVRLYGLVFLRTEYVLAIILAVYLTGIGLGSLAVRRVVASQAVQRLLNIFPLLLLTFVLLGLWVFPLLAQAVQTRDFTSLAASLQVQGGAVMLMTWPVTLILGAWLPLLVKHAAQTTEQPVGAHWYGVNAIGGSIGVCVAGFVLLPLIGTNATIVVAGGMLCLFGLYWSTPAMRRWALLSVPVLLLGGGLTGVGTMPEAQRLTPSLTANTKELYRFEDAVSITHVVEQADGQRLLLTDLQRMDASTAPAAVQTQMNQARLPLVLKPDARSVLFLGLGTGITASGSLAVSNLQRTAVELSKGAVIAAERWFAPVNQQIMQGMQVVHDDARRFLRRGEGRYDVIIGDVFHPDRAGRGALLSVEQFARAKARLSKEGILVQWLALNQFDVAALKIVLRSFKQVFPESRLFIDGFRLALVGYAAEPVPVVPDNKNTRLWLGRYWGNIDARALGAGGVESEWHPRIEYRLAALHFKAGNHLAATLDWLLSVRPILSVMTRQLQVSNPVLLEAPYAATQLIYRGWLYEMRGQMAQAQRMFRFAYQANPDDRWIRSALADRMQASLAAAVQQGMDQRQALLRILSIDPENIEALRTLWHYETEQGHAELAAQYRQRLKALSPLDIEVRS